jgi:hypothetical protein
LSPNVLKSNLLIEKKITLQIGLSELKGDERHNEEVKGIAKR